MLNLTLLPKLMNMNIWSVLINTQFVTGNRRWKRKGSWSYTPHLLLSRLTFQPHHPNNRQIRNFPDSSLYIIEDLVSTLLPHEGHHGGQQKSNAQSDSNSLSFPMKYWWITTLDCWCQGGRVSAISVAIHFTPTYTDINQTVTFTLHGISGHWQLHVYLNQFMCWWKGGMQRVSRVLTSRYFYTHWPESCWFVWWYKENWAGHMCCFLSYLPHALLCPPVQSVLPHVGKLVQKTQTTLLQMPSAIWAASVRFWAPCCGNCTFLSFVLSSPLIVKDVEKHKLLPL